jgi:hypothetical protein
MADEDITLRLGWAIDQMPPFPWNHRGLMQEALDEIVRLRESVGSPEVWSEFIERLDDELPL